MNQTGGIYWLTALAVDKAWFKKREALIALGSHQGGGVLISTSELPHCGGGGGGDYNWATKKGPSPKRQVAVSCSVSKYRIVRSPYDNELVTVLIVTNVYITLGVPPSVS